MLTASLLRRTLCATAAFAVAMPVNAQTVETGTPPARVGQIAGLVGDVSFSGAGSNGAWVAAQDNYPLTAGDSLYTQTGAEAAIALDSSRMTMAPLTELEVTRLDDQNFTATEAQGEVFFDLSALTPGQSFNVNTPGGDVTMAVSGEYDILTGPTTTVAVIAGAATVGGITLNSGQAATLSGGQAQMAALEEDGFVRHVLGELSAPPPPYVPQVVEQMTGTDELTGYGGWDQDPDYGAVWYPNVDTGWAPYREGNWAYVAPWGWTWLEAEPWGFAPFHYGRWIHRGARWGWVPAAARDEGTGYTPVYAPAVVTFFGLAAGAAITAGAIGSGRVGWVPLAPGEAYRPPYHASAAYVQRMNRFDIGRGGGGNGGDQGIDHYADRAGATYMPAAAMAHGERIDRAGGGPMPAADMARARPAGGAIDLAVRPAISSRPAEAPRVSAMPPGMAGPRAAEPNVRGAAAMARPQAAQSKAAGPEATRAQARPGMPAMAAPRPDEVPRIATRPEMPRVETPQAPRIEAPRIESPRIEAPPTQRIEAPRPVAPRVENAAPFPRAEAPRPAAPRPEVLRPAPPPRPPG